MFTPIDVTIPGRDSRHEEEEDARPLHRHSLPKPVVMATRSAEIFLAVLAFLPTGNADSPTDIYLRRTAAVRAVPGLTAFWDFMQREDGVGGRGRFVAQTDIPGESRFALFPHNVSRDFWNDGVESTLDDFPLLGRGPFGQAIVFHEAKAQNNLPVLLVPRSDLHDTRLDVKGPGKSVSMAVWLIYQGNNHAIAGLWHEGTDTSPTGIPAEIRVRGQRQYGMFAGLAANPGAPSVHVSENGMASFGDKYARHLAVSPAKMHQAPVSASPEELDTGWSVIGFVYDNRRKTVTAYMNGEAAEYWVENPAGSRFYGPAAEAWRQAWLARLPGLQEGENTSFPRDQFYEPPETSALQEVVESETDIYRVVLRSFEFTKVRVRETRTGSGGWLPESATLVAMRANPWYFGHDIYTPLSARQGAPFTIGRVIHSNRHGTLDAWFGGVAVYDQALSAAEMAALARIGREDGAPLLHRKEVAAGLSTGLR
jgi:hypothetical protein